MGRFVTASFMLLQTEFLGAIFSLSHGDFLSMWCSADLPLREEDATLYYELFPAAGWALDSVSSLDLSNTTNLEFTLVPNNNMSQASYVHQRTSLFVKVIANLHCFVPNICEGKFPPECWQVLFEIRVVFFMLIELYLLIHRAGEEPVPSQVSWVLANGSI